MALKECLKEHLSQRGSASDLGTTAADSTDYPDYAQAVAESVVSGRSELGLLVCSTGIGMSIAANKVPGIRAALVVNAETALLARQHNNANVLCWPKGRPLPTRLKIVDAFLERPFRRRPPRAPLSIKLKPMNRPAPSTRARSTPRLPTDLLEKQRQQENIELIASENFTSPAVMEARDRC